jgi:hypothetical protein
MAYDNFKSIVWSKYIQHELEKITVLQEDCNTRFKGEAGLGKTVKIIGVERPTVGTYVPGADIASAETPPDNSIFLNIDQYKYTHFLVDDIDEAQSQEGLMQAYMKESTAALAEARDSYIASLASGASLASTSAQITTTTDARKAVDDALVTLWDNGVKISDNVVITISPWFYALLKNALTAELSANVDMIQKGILGTYNGAVVKMSNNLYNDGTDDYMMVRTKGAIAFASGIEKTEAYRPDKQFADAVKVLDCYGAKLVRPKELYVIKARG